MVLGLYDPIGIKVLARAAIAVAASAGPHRSNTPAGRQGLPAHPVQGHIRQVAVRAWPLPLVQQQAAADVGVGADEGRLDRVAGVAGRRNQGEQGAQFMQRYRVRHPVPGAGDAQIEAGIGCAQQPELRHGIEQAQETQVDA